LLLLLPLTAPLQASNEANERPGQLNHKAAGIAADQVRALLAAGGSLLLKLPLQLPLLLG